MTQTTDATRHEQFFQDGYSIHAQPILPRAVVDAAVLGMDEVRAGRYDTGTPPQPSFWNPGDDPIKKLGKIEMPQIANQAIHQLLTHPALGELAAQVTGAKAVQIWWVQLLYKPPAQPDTAVTTNIGWHQDRHYWKSWEEGSELFTAWVALTDVRADCGPMVFVRGSHQWGYVPDLSDFFGKEDQVALRNHIQSMGHPDWEECAAILPPGGVSFHHNLTYHGSGPNLSGQPRRSFAIHMRTEKSRPRENARQGLTQFLDNLDYNPVIYGKRSDFRG